MGLLTTHAPQYTGEYSQKAKVRWLNWGVLFFCRMMRSFRKCQCEIYSAWGLSQKKTIRISWNRKIIQDHCVLLHQIYSFWWEFRQATYQNPYKKNQPGVTMDFFVLTVLCSCFWRWHRKLCQWLTGSSPAFRVAGGGFSHQWNFHFRPKTRPKKCSPPPKDTGWRFWKGPFCPGDLGRWNDVII